jgi:hypothetical protein
MKSFLILIWIFFNFIICGQTVHNFNYVNPKPGSQYASPGTNIIIKEGSYIDPGSINGKLINVSGSISGYHKGDFLLSDDFKTLVFNPVSPFFPKEKVTVRLKKGIKTKRGRDIGNFEFEFFTNRETELEDIIKLTGIKDFESTNKISELNSLNSLLDDIPQLIIDSSNNSFPGSLFLAPTSHLMIFDNDAVPIFYRKISGQIYDFKLQPSGDITYFVYPAYCFGLDSSLNPVDTFTTANGYTVDVHDLLVLPNGHYFILGKKLVDIDMSEIVPEGDSSAKVIDMAIQEFDASGNVVFQWSALDHYQITDADEHVSLKDHQIDFVHLNSIELDADSNIIISARNLNEITKIDYNTGEIIWRLGGENNQFSFINDEIGFSRQHDARRLSNGNISLFDNGVYHDSRVSSYIEYVLDEENKTAVLINRYSRNNIFSRTGGNVQELPNGNKLISWGEISKTALTEITSDNSIAFEAGLEGNFHRYRSFKFQWETNLFKTNTDTLDFGQIELNDSSEKAITLYNYKDSNLTINEFYFKDPSFSVQHELPLLIPGKDSVNLPIKFFPYKNGIFAENLYIRSKSSEEFIARKVFITGSTSNLYNLLDAPSDLNAEIDNNKIILSWTDNSNNEDGFVVERKQGDSLSANNFLIIDTVSANDTIHIDKSIHDTINYTYRVYAFNTDTISGFSNYASLNLATVVKKKNVLKEYFLYQNYPNPFNPTTSIIYKIGSPDKKISTGQMQFVTLKLYDILGNEIATLVNDEKPPGEYRVEFRSSLYQIPSGVYFYQLKVGSSAGPKEIFISTKKLILLK